VISGFPYGVNEPYIFLRYHTHIIDSSRRCGTTCQFQLQWSSSPTLKMGHIGCSESSVTNCLSSLRNIPDEQRSYRGADKSLARPGRKQARKHVRDARDFNNIETRVVIKVLFLHGKAPKEIHAILTQTIACLLPGMAKDLSATPVFVEIIL